MLGRSLPAALFFLAASWTQIALAQQPTPPTMHPTLKLSYDQLAKMLDESGFFDPQSERRSVFGDRENWRFAKTRSGGNSELFHVLAAGPTALAPDTIYLWFAPVNGTGEDNQRTISLIKTIAQRVFPQWLDAGEWMETASRDAWNRSARAMESRTPMNEDVIITTDHRGASINVFGVPPDLFFYMITTRQECRLGETFMLRRANPCLAELKRP